MFYKILLVLFSASIFASNSIFEKKSPFDVLDKNDLNPLMYASKKCYYGIAKDLIESGANVDVENKRKKTALHYASENACSGFSLAENDYNPENNDKNLIKLLIDSGSDINKKEKNIKIPDNEIEKSRYEEPSISEN